jgi:glycosyltransferase involved in cell wall biosynthesis
MSQLKIAIILETKIIVGGAFNQALNHIEIFKSFNTKHYSVVIYTTHKDNIISLKKIGIEAVYLKTRILDRIIALSSTNLILRRIQFRLKILTNFENLLIKNKIKLVYFLSPGTRCLMLQRINYIINLWDLCHRDMIIFPENRSYNKSLEYEFIYKNTLSQALLVITDSEELNEKVIKFYGIDKDQLLNIPFTPSPYLKEGITNINVLDKYNIKDKYFYYPAQMWPHKNHIRILEALVYLKNKNIDFKVIFTGFDHGNYSFLEKFILENGLEKNVKYLGFIDPDDISSLYYNSIALVMPTYYGPTNIPPLEAWKLGVPVLYSQQFSNQTRNGAIYIDPDSAISIGDSMERIYNDKDLQFYLKQNGKLEFDSLMIKYSEQIIKLESYLNTFRTRLSCYEY